MSRTGSLTKAAIELLTMRGFLAWRQNNHATYDRVKGCFRAFAGRKGVPDVCAVAPTGQFWGVEIKVGKDKLRPGQIEFREELIKRGGVYVAVKTIDDLISQLEGLIQPGSKARN